MIDGRFRFDNLVVGNANRLAVSAVRAVAESPGSVYNPLFIYSASGLGKTHLLGALGFAARSLHPELHVEYFAVDDFVDQLHSAIASGQGDSFRRRWQSFGVLLLDDVQFLTGRTETQSELLRQLCAKHNPLSGNCILEEVASALTRNVRELQSELNRLVAQQAIADI